VQVNVLSLDIASIKTGWAFLSISDDNNVIFKKGIIKNKSNLTTPEKLCAFRSKFVKLIKKLSPTHVVIEDVYSNKNIKTFSLLSMFLGVAQECCFSVLKVAPYVISTNTVKSFFKLKSKKDVFAFIVDIFGFDGFVYERDNDKTDAIAQLMCYCDKIIDVKHFRIETEYGFFYEV
jgi:Holliday junction resolvasome RuvABC endonuclease subunit